MSAPEEPSPFRIVRTPWRDRRIVWAGAPFRKESKLLPYLFHRYDVVNNQGWWSGFWRRKSAERWIEGIEFVQDPGTKGQ